MSTPTRSHPTCWNPAIGYVHIDCRQPSGRACIDCGEPAGTLWGAYWCPDCDVIRLDRISANLEQIAAELEESSRRTPHA